MSTQGPQYQFTLEFYKQDGAHLGSYPVHTSWEHVLEWARFTVTRHNASLPLVLEDVMGWVEPVWDEAAGEPAVSGVRAVVPQNGAAPVKLEVPFSYFSALAQLASSRFVKSGQLAQGDTFQYGVCAYPVAQPAAEEPQPKIRFTVKTVPKVLALPGRAAEPMLEKSRPSGRIDEQDMPVFIHKTVLDEAVQATRNAKCVETGGVLIGRLFRQQTPEVDVMAEVTAQIPALFVEQESASLAFTKETWTAADAAVKLRQSDEIYLGWWHSHPSKEWCKECPPEKRERCRLSREFFSLQDVALHRTVFPRAYTMALVITDSQANGLVWHLQGWRHGQLAVRGFFVLDE